MSRRDRRVHVERLPWRVRATMHHVCEHRDTVVTVRLRGRTWRLWFTEERPPPPVDTEAVRRAYERLRR